VNQLPAPTDGRPFIPIPATPVSAGPEPPPDLPLALIWGIIRRHWLMIGMSGAILAGLAVVYALNATPIYQGATSLRIDERKAADTPDVLRTFGVAGEVHTELEVLRSRSLVEDAVKELKLQLALVKPDRISRDSLISDIEIAEQVVPGLYRLKLGPDGNFELHSASDLVLQRSIAPGASVHIGGVKFTLRPASSRVKEIEFAVQPLEETVAALRQGISVGQVNREAKVAALSFRTSDRELAYKLPNTIADRFIIRRQGGQKLAAASTVVFLRAQLDTLTRQLGASEQALRQFRERERVVNPIVEGTSQVDRLIKIQSERGAMDAERSALASLLNEVQAAADVSPNDPSPYRRLLAFPTLLRSQAATELLASLAQVEGQRSELLSRRTAADPEVQAMDGRVNQLEGQLRTVAATYLEGLTNQVRGLDSTIQGFGHQLSEVPRRELEFARLQRQPKVLEEMYSLLQTRLKEAEIAQAVEDPSVQVVDRAVRPLMPVSPRKTLLVIGGFMAGLMMGFAAAFLREYLDKSVHTRSDVTAATGLPVLGLIPRIPRSGKRMALISERKVAQPDQVTPPPGIAPRLGRGAGRNRARYTFLEDGAADGATAGNPEPEVRELPMLPAPLRVQRMAITGVGTAIAEAYGSLQTNLLHSRIEQTVQAVVFTSAQPGEGKTTSAVNLSLSLTHRGTRVLLIDADLRRGTVHNVFDVNREPGLADVVRGAIPFEHACREVRVDQGGSLHYLTSGTLPANPSGMLASRELRELLEHLRGEYETIVIDSPPVNMMTDAALLGAHADGVVIVARAGSTHTAALGYAMEQLRHVRARVLGVVLNDIDFRRDSTYDAAYKYYDYGQYSARASS
jgi:capsular exopolysaccharide synthesis family protein